LWAGVDAGKSDHYCVVIDADGKRVLSRRVANDEASLAGVDQRRSSRWLTAVSSPGRSTLTPGGAALLIALLIGAEQRLLYIPGRSVHHASGGYRGEGKTDAKDAAVIADQARMRRDLQPLRPGDDIAVELRILTSRRTDLVADRTRAINRLRAQLLEYFPALERAFDYSGQQGRADLAHRVSNPRRAASRRRLPD
jgi:hypothetical protein